MDQALGFIEIQSLVAAIASLDAMLKAADVKFVAKERRLGGRLVTIVVEGNVSAVTAAVDAGVQEGKTLGKVKDFEVIARPHPEILKFLNLNPGENKEVF